MPNTMPAIAPRNFEAELHAACADCYADPLSFVRTMYPWPINGEDGPDVWQASVLTDIGRQVQDRRFDGVHPVMPISEAISSGHGIGKGALFAWIVDWIMSTRRHAQGTVTANTNDQLETKTWAAIRFWTKLCLTAHWFEINSKIMYRIGFRESWFCAPQTSAEDNSESFAGQHSKGSTSFYIFDEASNITPSIWKVAEGGLTDGEPMFLVGGNPTRRDGEFYRVCFGNGQDRWKPRVIDSRMCKLSNKALIEEWRQDYGEGSGFFRVRVRGLPPRASDVQFIDQDRVYAAKTRKVVVLPDEPLVVGADLAWGGADSNVIRFRRGLDARSIPPIEIKGEFTRDPQVLTTRLTDVLTTSYGGQKVAMLFLDSAGIAGPIGARLRQLGFKNVMEVNFGADSPDRQCRYFRDYMWQQGKQWLLAGAIDDHPKLETDLLGPGVRPDQQQRVWLESKEQMAKRGLSSPDHADALFLTFAQPVGSVRKGTVPQRRGRFEGRRGAIGRWGVR